MDRDGIINAALWNEREKIWDSPYTVEDFRLLPGVAGAVKRIRSKGFLAVVVSNQPGVAKRKCDQKFLEALNTCLLKEAPVDDIFYCLHHPEALVKELKVICECRKPKPGLLVMAAQKHHIDLTQSIMIGDQERDIEAGLQAGCRTIRVGNAAGAGESKAHLKAADLVEAVASL